MKLIVITRPDFFDGEAEAITALLDAGLEILHLRKPDAQAPEVEHLLQALPPRYLCRIVLHEHFELAVRYGLRGIHLNRRHPQPPTGYQGKISRSCHSLAEVVQGKDTCDYVFLSPVFDSISKAGYRAAFSRDELLDAATQGIIDDKVIALGGVDAGHVRTVRDMGFGGAAVLGDVWQHKGEAFVQNFLRLRREAMDPPVVLTIAGSDCSGGAGIQADIKTISAIGGYAASVITALTAQNTRGVQTVQPCSTEIICRQITSVLTDLPVRAIKIGMIPDRDALQGILEGLSVVTSVPIVYDPVMISTSGHPLMEQGLVDEVCRKLFPRCMLITPNLNEAALLSQPVRSSEEMETAARRLSDKYGIDVLLKGGHLGGEDMMDLLVSRGRSYPFHTPKVHSSNLHGTGCTLSSAIATELAFGESMPASVGCAKAFIQRAILAGRQMRFGQGNGPLWHFFQ